VGKTSTVLMGEELLGNRTWIMENNNNEEVVVKK
jgi:hypothetical protein